MYDYIFRAESIEDLEILDGDWIVNGLVPTEGLTIIDGKPKSGKSTLGLSFLMSVGQGGPWAGDERFAGCLNGQPSPVLYVGTDGRWKRELKTRSLYYPVEARRNLHVIDGYKNGLVFPSGQGSETEVRWREFAAWAAGRGFRVVVLDHLMKLAGARGVNDGRELAPVLAAIDGLVSVGIVPILIHHQSMHSLGQGRAMGHTTIHATMRSGLSVQDARASGEQVVNVLTNETAEMSLILQRLEGKPPVVLDWTERVSRREAKAKRERKPKTDINLIRAEVILAGPPEARANQSAAGRYLEKSGPEVMRTAKDGRQLVVKLVNLGLLAAAADGTIVPGEKRAA